MIYHTIKESIKKRPSLYALSTPLRTVMQKCRKIIIRYQDSTAMFRNCCLEISRSTSTPMFVKVGANDGFSGDPCSDIILEHTNWHGILIEPVPYCFERLKENFQDQDRFDFVKIAIGPSSYNTKFYYVDSEAKNKIPDLPYWYDQLGSFYRSHIVNRLNGVLEPFIIETEIDVRPLSELLAEREVGSLQLLHIDTEGYDYEVIKTLDLAAYTPTLIYIEHAHLSFDDKHAMRMSFRKHGYTVYDCGNDYFALNKKAFKKLKSTNL